ncbi:gns1 sur4 family domain-containing protein [Cyclospora cayetanensis]|uniref:Elongation of fatty acids protein n=1 Tax=Cyclospora cayetanensis TaxID=88456 RepID=A0A1D3D6K4_9EIME|nr:gns1 sur4 family domain-containing protein [Cyclospora cayetanensis]
MHVGSTKPPLKAAGPAAAVTVAAVACVVVAYRPFCRFLSWIFPEEAWSPGVGVKLAVAYRWPIIAASVLYLPAVYALQRYMRDRPAYSLRYVALLWNASLSLLSLLGFLTVLIQQPSMLLTSINPERLFSPPVRAVIALFTLTKAVEFGDTFLLVLKKKPLSFLHLYHHLTVTLYCWHAQKINADFAHGFATMNLGVHALMYLYFGLACCVSVPRGGAAASSSPIVKGTLHKVLQKSRPVITQLQIAQMLVGIYLALQGALYLQDAQQVANAKAGVDTAAPTPTPPGRNAVSPNSPPARCPSVTSTAAETATMASLISSGDDFDQTSSPMTSKFADAVAPCALPATAAAAAKLRGGRSRGGEALTMRSSSPPASMQAAEPRSSGVLYQLIKKEPIHLSWLELAAAAAGAGFPAVYGYLANGDWGLGLCVFGALRWALELHAAERIPLHT